MQAIIGGAFAASADLIAQRSRSTAILDYKSVLFQGLVASGYRVPLIQIWMRLVEPVKSAWKKVALDQLVFAPFLIFGYLAINAVNNGKSFAQFSKDLRDIFLKIFWKTCKVWPIVSWITFKYMSLKSQQKWHEKFYNFWAIYLILSAKGQMRCTYYE
jgi:hypothetical protein